MLKFVTWEYRIVAPASNKSWRIKRRPAGEELPLGDKGTGSANAGTWTSEAFPPSYPYNGFNYVPTLWTYRVKHFDPMRKQDVLDSGGKAGPGTLTVSAF